MARGQRRKRRRGDEGKAEEGPEAGPAGDRFVRLLRLRLSLVRAAKRNARYAPIWRRDSNTAAGETGNLVCGAGVGETLGGAVG